MSLNNCVNCSKVQKCDCLCHSVPVYAESLHQYHRPAQLTEDEPNFKAQQLAHYRKRFPALTEEQIKVMYEQNLYS